MVDPSAEEGDAETLAKLKHQSLKQIIDSEGLAVSKQTGGIKGRNKVDIAREIVLARRAARDNGSEQSWSSSGEKKKNVLEIKATDVQILVKADDGKTIAIGMSRSGKTEDVTIKIAEKEASTQTSSA